MTDMSDMTNQSATQGLEQSRRLTPLTSRLYSGRPLNARSTLNEKVYYELRKGIALAEFEPGEALVIRTIAAKLKVSRTPVIEALRRLERDGLVLAVPKWGATVREWNWDEIVEAFHIRRALEGEAAWLFVKRATPEDKERLAGLCALFNQYAANNDVVSCQDIDMELHLHIARSTRLPRLYALMENSSIERIAILGSVAKRSQDKRFINYRTQVGIHDKLMQALIGEEAEAARAAMWQHVSGPSHFVPGLSSLSGSSASGSYPDQM